MFEFLVGTGIGLIVGAAVAWILLSMLTVSQDCDRHIEDRE